MKSTKYIIVILSLAVVLFACEDMNVDNTNSPSQENIISNPRDMKIFAKNIYSTYWRAINGTTDNMQIASLVAADQFTSSWYTFGCFEISKEPRIPWDNSVTYEYAKQAYDFYAGMYTVLYMCNTLLDQLNSGVKLTSDTSIDIGFRAMAYFMQGIALGQLAITFDKAQIVTEYSDALKTPYSSYKEIVDSAVTILDKAAALAASNEFDLGTDIINGMALTNDLILRASHSFAARFLVMNARTAPENKSTDWKKVLSYTTPEISLNVDFGPRGDGGDKWADELIYFLTNLDDNQYFYAKVDCRLIHLMDPAYPATYPASGRAPKVHPNMHAGEALSKDKRFNKYFEFSENIRFLPERGTYHYSHYRYKRYNNIYYTQTGHFVEFREYENTLMRIEALIMLDKPNDNNSNIKLAAVLINNVNFPRKKIGELENVPLDADAKTILDALFYEREVELLGQSYFMGFSDMRRRDLLQKGTPLHFPIPALEYATYGGIPYSFGGANNPDGINSSIGGWK